MIDLVALAAGGYLGVFIASLLGSATVFVPVPAFLIIMAGGAVLNPPLVGIIAGVGAAIGELVSYAIGLGLQYGGKKVKREHIFWKKLDRVLSRKRIEQWFAEKKGPLIIFLFAATPLPDDIVGIICGAIRYDVRKFLLYMILGKIVLYVALAYAGFYGMQFLQNIL